MTDAAKASTAEKTHVTTASRHHGSSPRVRKPERFLGWEGWGDEPWGTLLGACGGAVSDSFLYTYLGPYLTSDPVTHFWKSLPHVHLVTCEVGSVRAHRCGSTCNKGRWETTLSLSKDQLNKLWNACMGEYCAAMQTERKRSHALMSKTSGSVIHGISRCRTRA